MNTPGSARGAGATASGAIGTTFSPSAYLRAGLRLSARNPAMATAVALLAFMVLTAFLSPVLSTHDPKAPNVPDRLEGPSLDHWFGTDGFGRDLYSRTLSGGRVALIVGFGVAFLTTIIGMAVGLITGYYPLADKIIMRVVDGIMAMPAFLLAIAIMTLLGATVFNIIVTLSIVLAPGTIRVARSSVLSLSNEPFVDAARAIGASAPRVLLRHIRPNMLAPVVVMASFVTALAILIESGLSFLGVGVNPDTPTWGNIMGEARNHMSRNPWLMFWPGMAITLTVLAFNLAGDGLRDILDPRLRGYRGVP